MPEPADMGVAGGEPQHRRHGHPRSTAVVAFGDTLMECQRLLQSTLEDWLLLGLRMGHDLPVLAGLSLNGALAREPLDAV